MTWFDYLSIFSVLVMGLIAGLIIFYYDPIKKGDDSDERQTMNHPDKPKKK